MVRCQSAHLISDADDVSDRRAAADRFCRGRDEPRHRSPPRAVSRLAWRGPPGRAQLGVERCLRAVFEAVVHRAFLWLPRLPALFRCWRSVGVGKPMKGAGDARDGGEVGAGYTIGPGRPAR